MTVSTTTNKVVYIGNGVATIFAIPFPFLEKEHLKVWQLLNDVQTERTDWSVSGGNMVFETAPADGAQILIMREVPLTQETDYRENEILPAETLERNFDKLTMQVQQLKEQAERAVTVDIFDNTDAASLIPSIRQAVSDCAAYAATAQNEAQEALTQAQTAANQAQSAATSATNAGNSETHTATMLETKANINADNFSAAGKDLISTFGLPDYLNEIVLPTTQSNYTFPINAMMRWGAEAGTSMELTLTRNETSVVLFKTGTYSGHPDVDNISAFFKKGDSIHFTNNPHTKQIYPLIGGNE